MFGRGRDALWQARVDDLKKEFDRERSILVAWIEQLQAQVGTMNSPRDPESAAAHAPHPGMALYISSEEEDLIDAHAQGLIDDEQFQQGMESLGRVTAEVN